MNGLGGKSQLPHRWRYELSPSCVVGVEVRGRCAKALSTAVWLSDADIKLNLDASDQTHDINFCMEGYANAPGIPIFEVGKWADALQMRSLWHHLKRSCQPIDLLH